MKTCAVIPAAGLGSRLSASIPKILLPLTQTETVLSILYRKLADIVDHIHIIASPNGAPLIHDQLSEAIKKEFVSISIQVEPTGMGDAIFQSYPAWSFAEKILILWGDQVFISKKTLKDALKIHAGTPKTIGLPVTKMSQPYVEYIFDANSKLIKIKQSREGDVCSFEGLADTGTFVLSVPDLFSQWNAYTKISKGGIHTGEVNFLPFLPFLSKNGWQVRTTHVMDANEARGINTSDDLLFFQNLYEGLYE